MQGSAPSGAPQPISGTLDVDGLRATLTLDVAMAPRPNMNTFNWFVLFGLNRYTAAHAAGLDRKIIIDLNPPVGFPLPGPEIHYDPPPFQVKAKLDQSLVTAAFVFTAPIVVT